jgi:hypothetical protein
MSWLIFQLRRFRNDWAWLSGGNAQVLRRDPFASRRDPRPQDDSNELRRANNCTLFRGPVHFDLVPDFEAHQVFAHFQRSEISFSGMRYKVWRVERHNMRIDR